MPVEAVSTPAEAATTRRGASASAASEQPSRVAPGGLGRARRHDLLQSSARKYLQFDLHIKEWWALVLMLWTIVSGVLITEAIIFNDANGW